MINEIDKLRQLISCIEKANDNPEKLTSVPKKGYPVGQLNDPGDCPSVIQLLRALAQST
jgi:hypothetical protein